MSDVSTSNQPSKPVKSPLSLYQSMSQADPIHFPIRGINCSIEVRGGFTSDLPSLDLDLEIDARPPDGQFMKIVVAKDNACDWVQLKQLYRSGCPPKKGFASMTMEMALARGWVMEVRVSVSFVLPTSFLSYAFSRRGDLLKADEAAVWLTLRRRRFIPSI